MISQPASQDRVAAQTALCRNLENYGDSLSCADPPHLFGLLLRSA